MKQTIEKTCKCGSVFTIERDQTWTIEFEQDECDKCMAETEARWEQEAQEAERLRKFDAVMSSATSLIPERMRQTSTDHPGFNSELWRQVDGWRPSPEKPWLGLIGKTGTCKTRCAFMKLEQIARSKAEDGASRFAPMLIDGLEFGRIVLEQFQRTTGQVELNPTSPATTLKKIRSAEFLVFDELGKVRDTPAIMAEAFALIDHRHAHNLPTIWTSNRPPQEFCATWPEEFAAPTAGRIVEVSTVIEA